MQARLNQSDHLGNMWPSPLPPVLTPPSLGLLNTLLALAFSVTAGGTDVGLPDTVKSTVLEVRSAPAGGGTLIYSGNPLIGALTLPSSQTLYVRAQIVGIYGTSPWSPDVQIAT